MLDQEMNVLFQNAITQYLMMMTYLLQNFVIKKTANKGGPRYEDPQTCLVLK